MSEHLAKVSWGSLRAGGRVCVLQQVVDVEIEDTELALYMWGTPGAEGRAVSDLAGGIR